MKKTQPTHTVFSMDSLYDGVVKQAERYGDKERYIYNDKVTKTEAVVTYRDMLDHVNFLGSDGSRLKGANVRRIRRIPSRLCRGIYRNDIRRRNNRSSRQGHIGRAVCGLCEAL